MHQSTICTVIYDFTIAPRYAFNDTPPILPSHFDSTIAVQRHGQLYPDCSISRRPACSSSNSI